MQDSDLIAFASVLVATLAAISSYRSARSAEKSNKINLHVHQKATHDAFFELSMHMTQKAEYCQMQEVSKFFYQAKNAKFYFEKSLANDIQEYFDLCFEIADLGRLNKTSSEMNRVSDLLKKERIFSKIIEEELVKKLTIS